MSSLLELGLKVVSMILVSTQIFSRLFIILLLYVDDKKGYHNEFEMKDLEAARMILVLRKLDNEF